MRLVSGESFGTVVLYVGVGTRYTVFKYQHAEWDFFIGAFIEWEAFFSASSISCFVPLLFENPRVLAN